MDIIHFMFIFYKRQGDNYMSTKKSGEKSTKLVYEFVIVVLLLVIIVLCVIIIQKRNNPDPIIKATPTPEPTGTISTEEPTQTPKPTVTPYELVEYKGRIEHIFFHSLIAFPELAFTQTDKKALVTSTWFKDFVTVSEFKKILQALYNDGYMLINANDIFEERTVDGVKRYEVKTFLFPKNKKPLIMSFDDTNYYSNKLGYGTVDKLILDDKGKVVTYTRMKDGREIISDDNEYIPIIDKFVEEHPDFSFNGAKGMICLTGFDGILGYRTHRDSPNKQSESEKVKPIVKALKDTGWYFASHSYKHGAMAGYNVAQMRDCAQKFKNEVTPLIGETKIYVYPYGSWKTGEVQDILYKEFGFTYFCSVGVNYYIKTRADMNYILFQDRANIDGWTLVRNGHLLEKYKDWGTPRFPSMIVDDIYNEEERGISRQEAMEIYSEMYNS